MIKEFGCIGKKLGHSFSKEIHNALSDYEYELLELSEEELMQFFSRRQFCGINVTVPYKETVIPFLDSIDASAEAIGAVNTVIKNKDGKLIGYNTDFYGMTELILHKGIEIEGKKVVILGTGGTSKTARAVSKHLGADKIVTVSRTPKGDEIGYGELYEKHSDAEVIINTTPVGMYPNSYNSPVDLSLFNRLSGVIDAVYNPLRTKLVRDATEGGIPAEGGLYMLVAQAVKASEIFIGASYPHGTIDRVFEKTVKEKEAIVLIGMPSSGKTTVGRLLSNELHRPFIDTDEIIVKNAGMSIPDIFNKYGEPYFRALEREAVKEAAIIPSAVIATGGGAVLSKENVSALKGNGRLYFIDRPLDTLVPTSDRPTAQDKTLITERYYERYGIYTEAADVKITETQSASAVANAIRRYYL